MGHSLSPEQKQLYRRVDETLYYLWDPIGVGTVPEARDEYESYLPRVFSLLTARAPSQEIIDFLVTTETETMGSGDSQRARERAERVVAILTRWREVLSESAPRA